MFSVLTFVFKRDVIKRFSQVVLMLLPERNPLALYVERNYVGSGKICYSTIIPHPLLERVK